MKMPKKIIFGIFFLSIITIIIGYFTLNKVKYKNVDVVENNPNIEMYSTYIDAVYFSWINYPDCNVQYDTDLFANEEVNQQVLSWFGITEDLQFDKEKYSSINYAYDQPYRSFDSTILVPFYDSGNIQYRKLILDKKGRVQSVVEE